MTIKIVNFRSLQPGPTFTVLGAVHGNEPCGAAAINRLVADVDSGAVALRQGTLQLVPVCNPRAYARNVRFVERNLNRSLYPKDKPVHYEDHIDPILCDALDRSDAVLDLHSYASQGGPFMFLSAFTDDATVKQVKSLGAVSYLVKPLDIQQIVPAVDAAFASRPKAAQAQQQPAATVASSSAAQVYPPSAASSPEAVAPARPPPPPSRSPPGLPPRCSTSHPASRSPPAAHSAQSPPSPRPAPPPPPR